VLSSIAVAKEVLAASAEGLSPDLAAAVRGEKNWRANYGERIVDVVEAAASSGTEGTVEHARRGLEYCYNEFTFNGVSLAQTLAAMQPASASAVPATKTFTGQGSRPTAMGPVPVYGKHASGEEFLRVSKKWSDTGVIEPSAHEAWDWVDKNYSTAVAPGLDDTIFVLFGAGAAIGPFEPMMQAGATVAAVDLARPAVWDRLIGIAERSQGGRLLAPSLDGGETLGADLLAQAPEVAQWVCSLDPTKKIVLGCYGYADGEMFVRLALAMDLITQFVLEHRAAVVSAASGGGIRECPGVAVSYLCSPTDAFLVDPPAAAASKRRYDGGYAGMAVRVATGSTRMTANYDGGSPMRQRINSSMLTQQGGNYAMAKRIQHWRAMEARSRGVLVSSNVAPSSKTVSVMKNALLAAGYGGANSFDPVEIFEAETANHIMLLLLLQDVFNPGSTAQPGHVFETPFGLFASGAVHGGFWRMAYRLSSLLEVAVLIHYVKQYKVREVALGAGALGMARAMKAKL
jgi:hypothetical protein